MKLWRWLIVCSLGVLLGCAGANKKKQFGGREVPAPKEPPPVPARKDEPLDPALVEAARKELVAASNN